MTEDETFNVLKRIPLDEMVSKYETVRTTQTPLFHAAGVAFETYALRLRSLEIHILRNEALKEGGWTIEEFFAAVEKAAIIDEVEKLNASIQFPQEIIDRAKALFPDMIFTQAKIKI